MFKFMIVFRKPNDDDRFENSYQDLLALVERMPNIIRRQVIHVMGNPSGQSPYHRILEVYFEDRPSMEQALKTPIGQEAGGQLMTFPQGSFEMIFAEVYEDDGTHIPNTDPGVNQA